METNLVDKGHEESRRGAKIVWLNVIRNDALWSAKVNCVCANSHNESDRQINLNTSGPGKRSEVLSAANINVNQSVEIKESIDDIHQRFVWFVIAYNRALKDSVSTFQVKSVRGSDGLLRSSFGIVDSD